MRRKFSLWLFLFFIFLSSLNLSHASDGSIDYIDEILKNMNKPCQDYDCVYLKQNLSRDTKVCSPNTEVAFSFPQLLQPKKVSGSILYEGVWPAKYLYNVIPNLQNGYDIVVRIHFKNQNQFDLKKIKRKLDMAAQIWQENSLVDFFTFRFEIVKNAKDADFSVFLTKSKSRGPYYFEWSTKWEASTYAHEIGHMLGLDDEYGTVFYHGECDSSSMMCSSRNGAPKAYHYYQIYKRIHCNDNEFLSVTTS